VYGPEQIHLIDLIANSFVFIGQFLSSGASYAEVARVLREKGLFRSMLDLYSLRLFPVYLVCTNLVQDFNMAISSLARFTHEASEMVIADMTSILDSPEIVAYLSPDSFECNPCELDTEEVCQKFTQLLALCKLLGDFVREADDNFPWDALGKILPRLAGPMNYQLPLQSLKTQFLCENGKLLPSRRSRLFFHTLKDLADATDVLLRDVIDQAANRRRLPVRELLDATCA
jgi:hypothetical protein